MLDIKCQVNFRLGGLWTYVGHMRAVGGCRRVCRKKRARKAEGRAALQRVDARRGVMVRRDVSGVGLSSPEL